MPICYFCALLIVRACAAARSVKDEDASAGDAKVDTVTSSFVHLGGAKVDTVTSYFAHDGSSADNRLVIEPRGLEWTENVFIFPTSDGFTARLVNAEVCEKQERGTLLEKSIFSQNCTAQYEIIGALGLMLADRLRGVSEIERFLNQFSEALVTKKCGNDAFSTEMWTDVVASLEYMSRRAASRPSGAAN